MTTFECWINGNKINRSLLYKLEASDKHPETGVFKVLSEYTMNGYRYYRTPVFVVWWDGKEKYNGLDYQEALSTWTRYKING